jgi:hypothetical protein
MIQDPEQKIARPRQVYTGEELRKMAAQASAQAVRVPKEELDELSSEL